MAIEKILIYLVLLHKIVLGTEFTYKGATTLLNCVDQLVFDSANWRGPPNLAIYWIHPDIYNTDVLGEKINRFSVSSNESLIINDTKLSDGGQYRCSKGNGQDLYNRSIDLLVRIKANKPRITASVDIVNSRVLVTEGTPLTMQCTSTGGNPSPTVTLYKGDNELSRTSTSSQDGDTFTVTLMYTFTPTRGDDRQQIECRSYWPATPNAMDLQQTSATLYLYLKPIQLTFLWPVSVVTGNNITATCSITGSRPAAGISWMYLGQTFTPSETVTEEQSSQTFTVESVLQRTVTAADNGKAVQCTVTHRALTNALIKSETLDVQFPVEQSSTSITGNKQIEANGVNQLSLICKTGASNPASDITWRNESVIISNSNGYTEITGANNGVVRTQVLTLRPTRHDDGDTITCSVFNVLPQSTDLTAVNLDLTYSPVIAEMSDMIVIEGDKAILECNASSKPPANFTWKKGFDILAQGHGTANYNGYDYTISTLDRAQTGTYTCTANNQLSLTDSEQTILTVLYPPDIDVTAVNTTVKEQSTTVTCGASGVPDQYTYQRWVHTWNGQTVTHPVALPNTTVLILTDLSYAHSGEYTCGASNGIKGVSHGSGTLHVKSFPVLVGVAAETKEIKTSGQLHQPLTATFQFFSNAGKGSVTVYWANVTTEEVGTVSYKDVDVQLPVFGSTITTPGTEAVINVTVKEESRFGRYEVRVKNEVDTVTLFLVIQPLGPPETPLFVNVTVLDHQSVNVTWISGFPNGLNQTFVIQYSTDNTTWRNSSLYGGLSSEQPHSNVISGLASSQSYYVRLLAINERGESTPTDIFGFVTEAAEPEAKDQSSIGLIAGAAAGGIVLALIVIAVVFYVCRRRRQNISSGKTKDKGALVGPSKENSGYDGDEEVINRLYESAGPQQNEIALSQTTSKQTPPAPDGGDVYAKVNKKPEVLYAMPNKGKTSDKLTDKKKGNEMDLYALPDKSKGKKAGKNANQKAEKAEKDAKKKKGKKDKTTNNTGDVYENAPSNVYANNQAAPAGNNIYEDTNIEVPPQTSKKPARTDGLLYADLEFKNPPKGKGQNKVIGIEDRCEYTTIDLTKKAKPLPDGDDAEKNKL